MFIPELPAGEYILNVSAEERRSKSVAHAAIPVLIR
jgi:hypothetical protein